MKEQKKRHHILRSGNEGKKIKHFNGGVHEKKSFGEKFFFLISFHISKWTRILF